MVHFIFIKAYHCLFKTNDIDEVPLDKVNIKLLLTNHTFLNFL